MFVLFLLLLESLVQSQSYDPSFYRVPQLQRNRFLYSLWGHDVSVHFVISPATTNLLELDTASNKRIAHTADPRAQMGKVLQGQTICGISNPDFLSWINCTMVCLICTILCYNLQVWQKGISLATCDCKHKPVGYKPDPEPWSFSFRPEYQHYLQRERPFWPPVPDVGHLSRLDTDYNPQKYSREYQSQDGEEA